jgi:hypothetical protein
MLRILDRPFRPPGGPLGDPNDLQRRAASLENLDRLQALDTPSIEFTPAQIFRKALGEQTPLSTSAIPVLLAAHVLTGCFKKGTVPFLQPFIASVERP